MTDLMFVVELKFQGEKSLKDVLLFVKKMDVMVENLKQVLHHLLLDSRGYKEAQAAFNTHLTHPTTGVNNRDHKPSIQISMDSMVSQQVNMALNMVVNMELNMVVNRAVSMEVSTGLNRDLMGHQWEDMGRLLLEETQDLETRVTLVRTMEEVQGLDMETQETITIMVTTKLPPSNGPRITLRLGNSFFSCS